VGQAGSRPSANLRLLGANAPQTGCLRESAFSLLIDLPLTRRFYRPSVLTMESLWYDNC